MGIKKKIFLVFSCCILLITLSSYFFIYTLFQRNFKSEIMHYQQAAISMNTNMMVGFLDSIRQTTLKITGDEAIGGYLNTGDITDRLEQINLRQNMISRFSHYASGQTVGSHFFLKNTFFLNDRLPIASYFETQTLNGNPYISSSNIFANTLIKTEDWYKDLISSGESSNIFLDRETNSFCYAHIVKNNFYSGPYSQEGQGVLVLSIKAPDLTSSFSFHPISENSGYALFSRTGELLLMDNGEQKLYKEAFDRYGREKSFSSKNTKLSKETYIMSLDSVNSYGLKVIFLTPYKDIQQQINGPLQLYQLIVFLIFLVLMAAIYLISDRFTQPIIRMAKTIGTIHDTRTFSPKDLNFSKDKELVMLCDSFSKLIVHNNQLIQDIQKQTEQQLRYELRMLQAQINPHFIFNAMDIISWMALSKNEDSIAEIVSSIANLMRYSIIEPDKMVPLSEELQNIREYINIQQLRRDPRLKLSIDTCEDLNTIYVPKFTVQPLIENSIAHGLDSTSNDIHILVAVTRENNKIILDVTDDGLGCDPSRLNKFLDYAKNSKLEVSNGIGIRNINDRLRLNFPGSGKLSYYKNADGHLTAHIVLDDTTIEHSKEDYKNE